MLRPARTATFAVPALDPARARNHRRIRAVETGEAAAELATRTDAVNRVLERHAALAESARNLFAVLTVAYAAAVVALLRVKRLARASVTATVHAAFLVLLLAAGGLVATAAHQGGVLVHGLSLGCMR